MPKSGCPKATNFQWHEGTRYHDTQDGDANNAWSTDSYHLAGRAAKNDMEQKFCMKTAPGGSFNWPKGQYCIFKKGNNCPKG